MKYLYEKNQLFLYIFLYYSIKNFCSSSQFINFRDSKLTRILQTSLGGNSLTAIICTVTLAVDDQTQNTLKYSKNDYNNTIMLFIY